MPFLINFKTLLIELRVFYISTIMKKYLSFCIILTVVFSFSQENTIKVVYTKAVKKITDNNNNPPELINGINYFLLANANESLFYFDKKLDTDYDSRKRLINRAGGGSVYFVNYKDSVKLEQTNFADDIFLIKKPLNEYTWKITNEFKEINDFKCLKATTEYETYSELRKKTIKFKIIAWFSYDIPYRFGPAGFNGLPGLILELQNGGFYYIATKISKTKTSKIEAPKNGKKITQKEFDEFVTTSTRDRYNIKN